MKLYYHPVSTTCRPIMLFAAESGIALDMQLVDLFTGAHLKPEYAAINPSCQVPVLDDGDFRLTECSAILKYLADKAGSPAYPKDLQQRARVNERMDWFNTGFYRDFAYGLVYPQIFPNLKRADEHLQQGTCAWGRDKAVGWLKVLNEGIIGERKYVCGDSITIADYMGAIYVLSVEAIGGDVEAYPNVAMWMARMRALRSWGPVNEAFYKYVVEPNKGKPFMGLAQPKGVLQPA
jgi:glutathione S-transferase